MSLPGFNRRGVSEIRCRKGMLRDRKRVENRAVEESRLWERVLRWREGKRIWGGRGRMHTPGKCVNTNV